MKGWWTGVLLLMTCSALSVQAQIDPQKYGLQNRYSISITSPTSLLSKMGVRFEWMQTPNRSVMVGYNQYWGIYPGGEGSAEFRHYGGKPMKQSKGLAYVRLVGGYCGTGYPRWFPNPGPVYYSFPGGFGGVGVGAGHRFSEDGFFMEISAGGKYVWLLNPNVAGYDLTYFRLLGPGAIADFHLLVGYQW